MSTKKQQRNKKPKKGMHRTTVDIPKPLWEALQQEALERFRKPHGAVMLREILEERYPEAAKKVAAA